MGKTRRFLQRRRIRPHLHFWQISGNYSASQVGMARHERQRNALRFKRVLTQRRQEPETQRGVNSNPRHGGVNVSQPVNNAMNAILDKAFSS
jgi:hypothetical protein